ncbi:MAG: AAA family ATPase, partial [Vallitaleaceae bacterium]|nr:AAA family ATPase [Vallitaleaceae bacterium]
FDEIEKAHPEVFHVLLQLLDEGRLTDSQGRTIDFKNTVIIMTSNIGSTQLLEGIDHDGGISEETREAIMQLLHQYFRPELLNRIDETVLFTPLMKEQIAKIILLSLKDIQKRLDDRHILLEITENAMSHMIEDAYHPSFGARPVKRFMQKYIETELGKQLLAGRIREGMKAQVVYEDGKYLLNAEAFDTFV